MNSLFLKASRLVSNPAIKSFRFVHKGPEGAPPMRYISPMGHVTRYLIICFSMLSYPTYVLWNLDHYRPRPSNELSEEMQEVVAQRKAMREEGKVPVLQDWPIIHEEKN